MSTPYQENNPQPRSRREDAEFDRLVTEHQQRIYYFIRSMVFNPDDAKDTLQDVNIVLYRKKENYEPGTNFKAWAFTIARFECLSYLSRYKKKQWTTLDTGLLESLADGAEEKADDVDDWLMALKQCLLKLSDEAKFLIQSRYQQRTPLEQTAQQLQTSIGAIKQKLFRARKQLRDCVLKRLKREDATG
ncbi:MAG: sigma-70 family RNA polymerase sigma factor [Akkermansiaceae bacterium]